MNNPKFQLFQSPKNSQFYFRLNAVNGETILQSEGYTQKQSCLNGIDSVKVNAPIDERYDRRTAKNGQPYFVLKAANGEIIGNSEMYSSTAARDNGIQAVMRDAPGAPVEDVS